MLANGTSLGRFVILGLAGRGAMGAVYSAYDPTLDRKIAIKLVRSNYDSDSQAGRSRLMREAQATARIAHPNVVVVYEVDTLGDQVFIAMEFVEGHTLQYWLQFKRRSWLEILDVFIAAGRGLAAAHDKDLIHRDFKPDNVMVSSDGQVRVMDFGLARSRLETAGDGASHDSVDAAVSEGQPGPAIIDPDATQNLDSPRTRWSNMATLDEKLTQTGALMGTPAFMSPEQFRGHSADARSDQFSFCVALFQAVFEQRPFPGGSFQELAVSVTEGQLIEPPSADSVPSWLRAALKRGLSKDPEARFPTMNDLLAELDRRSGAARTGFARRGCTPGRNLDGPGDWRQCADPREGRGAPGLLGDREGIR